MKRVVITVDENLGYNVLGHHRKDKKRINLKVTVSCVDWRDKNFVREENRKHYVFKILKGGTSYRRHGVKENHLVGVELDLYDRTTSRRKVLNKRNLQDLLQKESTRYGQNVETYEVCGVYNRDW